MRRMMPAMLLAGLAGMVGGFPGGTGHAPGVQAPTPNLKPGDIPSNGNKADRLLRAIMGGGGRSWRRAGNKPNGRPDTGTRRAQRAARKRRNVLRQKARA